VSVCLKSDKEEKRRDLKRKKREEEKNDVIASLPHYSHKMMDNGR
jgi:hypothetical protein